MTVRDIQGHLREQYGIDVSPGLVSVVTDAVLEQVAEWQNRPLDALYPLVFFDALRVKIRDEGTRAQQGGLSCPGRAAGRHQGGARPVDRADRGAKFWLRVMNKLRNCGVADMLVAVVDGLKGFPEGDQRHLPGSPDPDMHRPSDPALPGICLLEGAARCRRGA